MIIVFLVAQVAWWLWFQNDYISSVAAATEAAWRDDAVLANALLAFDSALADELSSSHPHLLLQDGRFVVDEALLSEFHAEQRGHLRMFRFEGVFFVLVVLAGLWVLARSLLVARELEQRQRNFLLAVTHEFRTPISTLRLLIETLQLRPNTQQRLGEYLERMQRELTRLESSSDKVLASARLEQTVGPRELRPVDLNVAVRDVVAKYRVGLETRGAQLEVSYSPAPLLVDLESSAFEMVLTNLLDNAVKYSDGPLKPVRLEVARRGRQATLIVADEGIGVPAHEAQKIFERFYRPGSEMNRRSQGVGLGLHLVKNVVAVLGGSVRHEPNLARGRGSLFVVSLPLSESADGPGAVMLDAADPETPAAAGGQA